MSQDFRSHMRSWLLGLCLGLPLVLVAPAPRPIPVTDAMPAVYLVTAKPVPQVTQPPCEDYDSDPRPLPRGAVCRISNTAFRHPARIVALAVDPDGSTIYTLAGTSAYAWDLRTGRMRWQARDILKSDGGYPYWNSLLIGRGGAAVMVWKWEKEKTRAIRLNPDNGSLIDRDLEFINSPATGYAARPNRDFSRYLWRRNELPAADRPHSVEIRDLLGRHPSVVVDSPVLWDSFFSRDGRLVIDRLGDSFRVYSAETGKTLRTIRFPHPGARISAAEVTPDGREVIVSGGGAVLAVDLQSEEWRVVSNLKDMPAGGVLLDPTGRTLAIENTIHWELRDFATGRVRAVLDTGRNTGGEFTPDGKRFIVAHDDRLLVYEVETGTLIGAPVWPVQVRLTTDNKLLMQSGPSLTTWDPLTGRQLSSAALPDDFARYVDHPFGVDIDARGERAAYPTVRNTISVIELRNGSRREMPTVHKETPAPAFMAADHRLLVAAADGVRIVDPTSNQDTLIFAEDLSHGVWARGYTTSPGGQYLADHYGNCRNLESKQRVPLLGRNHITGHFARFTPDGRHLLALVNLYGSTSKEDDEIVCALRCGGAKPRETRLGVWELPSGRQIGLYPMSPPIYTAPEILPDGRSCAYLDANANLVIAELATGKVRRSFRTDGWDNGAVDDDGNRRREYAYGPSIDCSADGRFISTHVAGSVLVWDMRGERSRPGLPPDQRALETAWSDSASDDGEAAFEAIRLFAAYPERSVPFIRDKYAPARTPDPARIDALMPALADPEYRVRERATGELVAMGPSILPSLRKAARATESPEVAARLADIQRRVQRQPSEHIRLRRAVEAVDWMGTPDAIQLLKTWASGTESDPLTGEARSVLERSGQR